MKRVKSLFVAASIIAIVVGVVQIAGNVVRFRQSTIKLTDVRRRVSAEETETATSTRPNAAPEATGSLAANPLAPPSLPPIAARPAGDRRSVIAVNRAACRHRSRCRPRSPSLFEPAGARTESRHHRIDLAPGRRQPAGAPAPPAAEPRTQRPTGCRPPSAAPAAQRRDAGDAAAAYEVGVRFAEGRGVPVNLEEAAHWFERAASKGLAPAQFRYASLLEKGQGVKKDLAQARRLYLAAAAKGNGKAMHNLAVLYAEGIDGKPDYATAAQWFRKAAERGIADSQYNLGVLCARGLGIDKNLRRILQVVRARRRPRRQGSRQEARRGRRPARRGTRSPPPSKRSRASSPSRSREAAVTVPCAAGRLGSRRRRAAPQASRADRPAVARLLPDGKTVNKRGLLRKSVIAAGSSLRSLRSSAQSRCRIRRSRR